MPFIKKVYRDKKNVGPLVGSQEQRALLVPRLSRGLTAINPQLCSSFALQRLSFFRASEEKTKRVLDALGGTREVCFLGKQFC